MSPSQTKWFLPLWASFPFLFQSAIDRTTGLHRFYHIHHSHRTSKTHERCSWESGSTPRPSFYPRAAAAAIIVQPQDSLDYFCVSSQQISDRATSAPQSMQHSREYARKSNNEKSRVLLAFNPIILNPSNHLCTFFNLILGYTAKFALGKPEGLGILAGFANSPM